MKSQVRLSTFSFILTMLVFVLFGVGMIATYGTYKFVVTTAAVLIILVFCMIYAPLSISVNKEEICVNSPFKIHTISLKDIESIERFQPTMGSQRICGSGGFMGYWGIFKENDIDRYTAYYGKASDCFIIRLKNGSKYVLGCKDPDGIIAFVNNNLSTL